MRLARSSVYVLALALVTGLHALYREHERLSGVPPYSKEPTPVGQRIESKVVDDSAGIAAALSDVHSGYCRYVVLAVGTCPHCRSLAVRWTVTVLQDTTPGLMPEGWRAFWVFGEAEAQRAALDKQFPAQTYHGFAPFAVFREAGVIGVPYHLVLDRRGRVVGGGLGGALLPRKVFKQDCTLAAISGQDR